MEGVNPNNQALVQKHIVTAAEFSAKFRSKPEVFRFLSYECNAYLPPYDSVTVWHLRDLAGGKRTIVKATAIKTIQVPHFEGLSVERMLAHAMKSN